MGQVLDVLDENDAKCTFFNIASFGDVSPESVLEMVLRGHELGNHLCEVSLCPYMVIITN